MDRYQIISRNGPGKGHRSTELHYGISMREEHVGVVYLSDRPWWGCAMNAFYYPIEDGQEESGVLQL